jgi:hypothetical protein
MFSPAVIPETPIREERRHQVRVSFSPARRPRLQLDSGHYDVLDASLEGLRVRHADPARPLVGDRLSGHLHWPDLGAPVAIAGKVVRVELTELALTCDQGQLPIGHILAEAARRRDARDARDTDGPEGPEGIPA